MADIKVLGESLLADQRKRNDRIYKETKREAYKLGLMGLGVGMLNSSLQKKTADFLTSESAMAARAKQRRGYDDAQFFVQQQEQIEQSGLNAQDYFAKQMLPTAKEMAMEVFKENEYDPDSYNTVIRGYVNTLAQKKAAAHMEGFESAAGMSTPEEFEKFQQMHSAKHNTGFNWLSSSIKGMLGGKKQAELDQEVLSIISNSPEITNAETTTAARRAYSQLGSIDIAQRVAGAVESGRIEKVERIVTWNVGDTIESTGVWGDKTHAKIVTGQYEDGSLALNRDGTPMIITHQLNSRATGNNHDGNQSFTGLMYRPDFARAMETLTPAELKTSSDSLQATLLTLPEDGEERKAYDLLVTKYAAGADGTPDPAIIARNVATQAKILAVNTGIDTPDAQNISTRIMLNRANRAMKDSDWSFSNFMGNQKELDFSGLNLTAEPDSIEYIKALGDLELTASAVSFDNEQLYAMVGNVSEDFSQYDEQSRIFLLEEYSNQDKYSFLHFKTADGSSIFDILLEIDSVNRVVEPTEDAPPTNTTSAPMPQATSTRRTWSARFKEYAQGEIMEEAAAKEFLRESLGREPSPQELAMYQHSNKQYQRNALRKLQEEFQGTGK